MTQKSMVTNSQKKNPATNSTSFWLGKNKKVNRTIYLGTCFFDNINLHMHWYNFKLATVYIPVLN